MFERSMTSAPAGTSVPMRVKRPLSTTITWLGEAAPVAGSMRRPARMAMVWAGRERAEKSKRQNAQAWRPALRAALPCFRMDGHRKIVISDVGEAECDAAFGIESDDRGAVEAGQHPAGGEGNVIERAADRKSTRLNSSHGYISYA